MEGAGAERMTEKQISGGVVAGVQDTIVIRGFEGMKALQGLVERAWKHGGVLILQAREVRFEPLEIQDGQGVDTAMKTPQVEWEMETTQSEQRTESCRQKLERAWEELEEWRARYRDCEELANIFAAMDMTLMA